MSDKNCLYLCIARNLNSSDRIEYCELQSHISIDTDLRLRYRFTPCISDNYLNCEHFPKLKVEDFLRV